MSSPIFSYLHNGSNSPRSSRPGTPVMVDGTKFDFTYQDPDFLWAPVYFSRLANVNTECDVLTNAVLICYVDLQVLP